jgi:ArsR family transcriptional regulator
MIESTTVEATPDDAPPRHGDAMERAVQRFKALGDPTRLRIVQVLADGERCVCEIQGHVDVAPNVLSHHLKVLRDAGLVLARRRGRWIDYRLDPDGIASATAALTGLGLPAAPERPTCGCGSEAHA